MMSSLFSIVMGAIVFIFSFSTTKPPSFAITTGGAAVVGTTFFGVSHLCSNFVVSSNTIFIPISLFSGHIYSVL